MELEIRVSYFGAANKFQKQSYTQAIKQAFKIHSSKQVQAMEFKCGAIFYSYRLFQVLRLNPTRHKMRMVGFDTGFWKYIFKTVLWKIVSQGFNLL